MFADTYSSEYVHFFPIHEGIGSTWEFLGVTGAIADNCPYVGTQATEEYKLLSGCDTIPIEQEGTAGSRCKHWSETCLVNELMTTTLNDGSNPLSRITVGGLEDLGYVVDYSNAGAYTRDNIDPSCLCNVRKDRQLLRQHNLNEKSLFGGKHGDVVSLDDLIPGQSKRENKEQRQLSESLRQYALTYGLQILDESAARRSWASAVLDLRQGDGTERNSRDPKRVRYAGHYYISIIMRQGDDYFGVLVVRDADDE
jgi:Leishmanolysin